MSEKVGGIYYECSLDTAGMVAGQRRVQSELDKTTGALDEFNGKLTAVARGISLMAAAMAAWKSANMADDMRMLGARIEVAAGNMESGATAMAALESISKRTGTSISANAEVFTRLNQSILQMGGTQQDTLNMTELLGKAIRVSGASAVEAKSAMLQFGQAMGSGKLQGDELRSLMENAPYLMKQLADGIGVPVGALKNLGAEGKLTADVVANALKKASTQIDEDFQKFPQTISSAMAVAVDAAGRANSKLDELSGTSTALTGITKGIGDAFDEFAKQLGAASNETDALGRNKAISSWAEQSKYALSYVVDAIDIAWQTISVFGRNVAYVFTSVGAEIGGIGAQIAAVMAGDFAGAKAIGDMMTKDADDRRVALDAADKKTLSRAKTTGQAMRDAWDTRALFTENDRGSKSTNSKLKAPADTAGDKKAADEARKLATKKLAAQEYYDGLVAGNKTALDKINADEQKALTENQKRMVADGGNAEIYGKAKLEIYAKFARERTLLEEKGLQEAADLSIAITTDASAKIEAVQAEAFRKADAAEKLGTKTHTEAEQAKTLATFTAEQARLDIADRNEKARADARITLSTSQEQRILLVRDEAMRQAEEGFKRGRMTFEEQEAAKVKAAFDAKQQLIALQASHEATKTSTLGIKASAGGAQDQEAYIRAQAAAAMQAEETARLLDLDSSQIYADKKTAIEAKMQADIAALRASANMAALSSTSDIFGSLMSITKNASGEQSDIYKTMFAAQKAFSIAQSIVAIQTGIAQASSLPWPANLGAMSSVAAATASIVSTIASTSISGGRQYGGAVSADSMYRVNEKGAPEMFTASNGSQFMLPTSSGSVTAADKVGGGQGWTINISNAPQGTTASVNESAKTIDIAVARSVSEVANQIGANSGPVWSAMRGASNVVGRL